MEPKLLNDWLELRENLAVAFGLNCKYSLSVEQVETILRTGDTLRKENAELREKVDALTRERDELREKLAAKSETQRIDLSTWLASEADAAKARAEWRERSAETLGVLREIRDAVKAPKPPAVTSGYIHVTGAKPIQPPPAAQPEVPPMPEEPVMVATWRQLHRDDSLSANLQGVLRYIDALKASTFPASKCGGAT
jgi:hypothetical protein